MKQVSINPEKAMRKAKLLLRISATDFYQNFVENKSECHYQEFCQVWNKIEE